MCKACFRRKYITDRSDNKGNIIHKYAEKPKENIDLFVEDELKRYGIEYDFENVLEP